jgi:hypothetical protein
MFTSLAANAQGKPTKFVQPFACTSGSSDTSTAAFINVSNRFPLQINTDGTNGTYDDLGALIVVPSDTPANTVSFQVVPTATTQFQFITIQGNWRLPNGQTGSFFSNNIANLITGNQAKNKNLQFTFDLQNFNPALDNVKNAPAGSTITELILDVEVFHQAGNKSGSTIFDNFFVNGQPVPVKIPQSAGCILQPL